MITNVKVDVSKLLNDASGMRYKKYFGSKCKYLKYTSSDGCLNLKLVEDEEAKFINFFGVFVDTESGNIGLGMFPDPNDYYCIGNIYNIIAKVMFNSEKMPDFIDKKYILEQMKVNASISNKNILESIKSDYMDNLEQKELKYKSLLLNILDKVNIENDVDTSKYLKYFKDTNSDDGYEHFSGIALSCIAMLQSVEKVAVDFYGAFIAENSFVDSVRGIKGDSSLKDVMSKTEANLEQLTVEYLKYGIPMNFLLAMKSYAMGIKQRKKMYSVIESKKYDYTYGMMFKAASMLSSMQYMVNREVDLSEDKKVICYNIIDLLRAVGRECDFFFSLDVLMDMKNKSVFEGLEKRFDIEDTLKENGITEEEFALSMKEYMTSVYPLVSEGCTYTRKVRPSRYNMIEFSVPQMISSGKLFERVGKLILSNI